MGIAKTAAGLLGEAAPPLWTDVEENIFIPYNQHAAIIPEYENMNGSVEIKQADVVLINYPLEFRLNASQALNDLDFVSLLRAPLVMSNANSGYSMRVLNPLMVRP